MFIENTACRYTKDGAQRSGPALFLILVQDKEDRRCCCENTRAVVRKVSLRQCGHFMMGTTKIAGHEIYLSGAYGNDGLIVEVPKKAFDKAVPLPEELYEAWDKGGGHNSAGNERDAMREWALTNIKALTK